MEPVLEELWGKAAGGFAHVEAPSVGILELLLVTLAAAAVVAIPVAWRFFALLVTLIHELGHACAGIMTGRIVTSIKVDFDHSGATNSYGNLGGPGEVWCTFWGYPVPAIVGGTLVWAGLSGWAPAALTIGSLVLFVTILVIRNWAGLAITLGAAAVTLALVLFAPAGILGYAALALGVALLVGAVRGWANVLSIHTKRPDEIETSDAHALYRSTGIPAPVWLTLFAIPILGGWVLAGTVATQGILASAAL